MSENWRSCVLGDLVKIKHGFAFPGSGIVSEKTEDLLLTPGNFEIGGGFKSGKNKYFNGEVDPKYILPAGEVIVTMTDLSKQSDTLGYSAKVPSTSNFRCLHNQRIGRVVPVDNSFCLDFVYWLMRSRDYRHWVVSRASGSTVKHTSPSRIEDFEFSLPPLYSQKAIAHILGTLDDKIELNRKINETLEGIAKALFKSWFLDFDPARAKAEGRSTGLPDQISELFPDSFEESELGEIPKGWSVGEIGDFLDLERDSVTPSDSGEEMFDYYSIPAYDEGLTPSREAGQSIKSNKYLVTDGVFMISKLNPRFPRIWVPSKHTTRRRICSTEFLVCRPKVKIDTPFVLHVTKSRPVVQQMSDLASGTSNSHQRVRPADFVGLPFVKPSAALVKLFSEMVGPMIEKHLLTRDENQALSKTRDTLLPRLISGELRVPDAEKMLEEVGI